MKLIYRLRITKEKTMEIKKITFGLIAFMVLIMATAVISEAATPMVAAGNGYIVGLKSDGTVVTLGLNSCCQCDMSSWTGITQVATGRWHIVGLKSDGTVVLAGPDLGNVDDWNLDVVDSGDDNDDGCFINGL